MNWESIKENGWQLKKENEVRILSIDGGGIRGLFPAQYLAEIENISGRKINEFFDLIVGTSTGGIIALALGAGIEAKDIVKLYKDNAKLIFKPKKFSIGGFVRSKYDNKSLKKLLEKVFTDIRIKDSKTMLCITSIEFNNAVPKVYKTPHNKKLYLDGDKEMWKVAMATSAAPIYFPAARVFRNECNIDGGLWANNPSIVGAVEALDNGYDIDKIKILSVGTGKNIHYNDYNIAIGSSILRWKKKIVDLILEVQSKSTANIAKLLLKDNFTEINFSLSDKIELDAIDKNDINSFLNAARVEFQNTYRINKNIEEKFFKL